MVAGVLGVVVLIFAIVLEVVKPWKEEVPSRLLTDGVLVCTNPITCPAWPPSVGGALIGLIQIPALLVVQTFLGSATSYQVIVSLWMRGLVKGGKTEKLFPYMATFSRPHQAQWWQIPYIAFVVLFSLIWAASANDVGNAKGLDAGVAFIGGFLMLFGSRWADGCTSGHGISGCAILTMEAFVAVPMMFAGGIATAFAWDAAGGFRMDQ
jgi:hypothetical protein